MCENFKKFIKNVLKNERFLILRSEENLLLLGMKLDFIEHTMGGKDPFKPPVKFYHDREWPVFFLITNKSTLSETEKMFTRKKLPILNLAKEKKVAYTEKNVNEILEKFVKNNFRDYSNRWVLQ